MKRILSISIFFILASCFLLPLSAQNNTYILNGNAVQDKCNCYTLTDLGLYENGSVWNAAKIDLTNSFDFVFNVNLGCDETGADGMVFMLQPISTSIGVYGGGMGFENISPSIGISLDTYMNPERNDPPYDHISIQANGVATHGTDLSGPVQASSASDNIEDCQWHLFRINWDAATHTLKAYFDGELKVQTQTDLVGTIFNNDPMVYWGFTAATGESYNVQKFCTYLNPDFKTDLINNTSCVDDAITFNDQSKSFAPIKNYYWDFGDGTTSTSAIPPSHTYTQPSVYKAKLVITGLDGCISDTLERSILIADKPVANFEIFDTCFKNIPRIKTTAIVNTGNVSNWSWQLDGAPLTGSQQPILSNIPLGSHQLKLSVKSSLGCLSDTATGIFIVKPVPQINFLTKDGCINTPVSFEGQQTDNATTIKKWNWQFENNQSGYLQSITHSFTSSGFKNIQLTAFADNGCSSEIVTKKILINEVKAFAGDDLLVLKDNIFQLKGQVSQTGNTPPNINWSPAIGLENSSSLITKGMISDDQEYTLSVKTAEGCTAEDVVKAIIFKGSGVYVPAGFTPNNDGKNETLKPLLISIKQLYFFSVYNRWGELIFNTTKPGEGWDGTIRGVKQPTGTYVWILKAADIMGNMYDKKGTTTLIR